MNAENFQCEDAPTGTMCCKQRDGDFGEVAMIEWKPTKLNELGFVGRGKSRHRPRNAEFLYGGPYPFFQTGDIKAANFYLTEYSQTYSEEGLKQSKLWKPGTLCITIAANIAESAILGIEGCFPDSVVGFIADPDKADVYFIKYYMEILKLQMQSVSRGTTQDNLSVDKLLTFDFQVPPLPVQRRIAGILSAYDELIENSQRRIRILEEMARALYREWFVHFRFPGHENHPLVPSSLGEIPQGWEVKLVKDILSRRSAGTVYRDVDVKPEGAISVIDQSTNELLGFHDNEPDHFATTMTPIAIFGDHTCKMQLLIEPFSVGPNVVPFAAGRNFPMTYIFYTVHSLVQTQEYKRHWISLNAKEVVVSDQMTAQRFASLIQPMLVAQEILSKRIRNLHRTRDLLLPRLLSGQVNPKEN